MIGHFTALLHNARELCQLDYRGEIVPREQQTKFCSQVPIQCVTDNRTIDVGFLLGFEVELSRIKKLLEDERLAAVVHAGAKETIPRLAKYGPWKLYDFNMIPLFGSGPIRLPFCKRFNIFAPDLFPVAIAHTIKAPMFWAKYPPQPQLLRL